jgi:FOG: Ankyrin repeat
LNAVKEGYSDIIRLLVGADIRVNLEDQNCRTTSLHEAAENGRAEIVKILLENRDNNAEPDLVRTSDGRTPLHLAAMNGDVATTRILISYVKCLDPVDPDYRTPLHLACLNGHNKVVNMLIDAGADLECLDNEGTSPLHLAQYLSEDTKTKMEKKAGKKRRTAIISENLGGRTDETSSWCGHQSS